MSVPHDPKPPQVDFPRLAADLLLRAEDLVPRWLPTGFRKGHYWYVGDFDGGEGKSANVNLRTGAWGDNGRPGDSGHDLISLYGRIHGLSNLLAGRELMADAGWREYQVQTPAKGKPAGKRKKSDVEWMPIHPVPADAPDYRTEWAHYSRGVPPMHWEYRDRAGQLLGLVVRFDTSSGKKDVQPISFCQGSNGTRHWRYKAFNAPRPLYGLWRLPPGYSGPVIICEGEKKSDALHQALGGTVPVLSWPGGCNTPHMAGWDALAGCASALCWPDADAQVDKRTQVMLPREQQPGFVAMRKVQATLAALGVPTRLVDIGEPGALPDGWDAGNAVAEGWTAEQLRAFMARLVPEDDGLADAGPGAAAAASPGAPPGVPPGAAPGAVSGGPATTARPPAPPAAQRAGSGASPPPPRSPAARAVEEEPRWRDAYIRSRGAIRECVPNVMLTLHHHPAWQGVLGFDEFSQRVLKRAPAPYDPEPAPGTVWQDTDWHDVDDTRTAAWIARREDYVPSASMVAEAINEAARAHTFHPVRDWLNGLRHDGVPRIDLWLSDLLGVEDTPYTRKVSRYFLVGMCMRVIRPGCKFDTCLVLEGGQGKGKSMSLQILGGPWFSDTELDLSHKDSMSSLRGKWLHEFGELGSLARAESTRQKSFLSRQIDEFRPVYGRREIRCPRQVSFGGTTNEWAWNRDPTGGRRFWPVEVSDDINVAGLAAVRDQLFAEAYTAALAGERYWPDSTEQRELFDPEQLARETPDALAEMLAHWMDTDPLLGAEFSMADAAIKGLKLDAKSLQRDIQTRIGHALRKLGCERVEYRNAAVRFMYKRPAKTVASSSEPVTSSSADDGGGDVPF